MASADELVELKRRLMSGEISADEFRQAKIALYQSTPGAPPPQPADSGRLRVPAGGGNTRRARNQADMIASIRGRIAAKTKSGAARAATSSGPAAAAIEAKRRKMAASLARRQEPKAPPVAPLEAVAPPAAARGLDLVVIVRPRGIRKTERLAREAAAAMRAQGLALAAAELEAERAAEAAAAEVAEEQKLEDLIERRLREARERLRGGG
ncbi:MAG: hypothetical protein JKY65_21180 [Planctomycetes bacterium]|nr:hypothetical protein [Planctomycetota bacterium]